MLKIEFLWFLIIFNDAAYWIGASHFAVSLFLVFSRSVFFFSFFLPHPPAGRAICYALIRACSAWSHPPAAAGGRQHHHTTHPPTMPPTHQPTSQYSSPFGAISFNVHCRLMQDLCTAINMKSCAKCSFHLNVIKHTISFGIPSLYNAFWFSIFFSRLQVDPKVAFPRRAHPKVSTTSNIRNPKKKNTYIWREKRQKKPQKSGLQGRFGKKDVS